jgi:hypothetical protein
MPRNRFSAAERNLLLRLTTPERVQRFLDEKIVYDDDKKHHTCRSPRRVLRDRLAHCLEGALFAAAALRLQGHPPLILDFEAVRDVDHVVTLFRKRGHWGAIAKSNYAGLRFREPVYRNLRELAMSYFEHYFNHSGEKTLRSYSRPVNLTRFDRMNWMTAEEDLWEVPEYLCDIAHTPLLTAGMERHLNRVDHRLRAAGLVGHVSVASLRIRRTSASR